MLLNETKENPPSFCQKHKLTIIIIICPIILLVIIIPIIISCAKGSEDEHKRYVPKNETLLLSLNEMLETVKIKNVTGEGCIRWSGWKDLLTNGYLTGDLKIPYINDEIYTSMKLPSEAITFNQHRINPSILSNQEPNYTDAVPIGSVYPILNTTLPEKFNICLGRMTLFRLENKPDSEWKSLNNKKVLNASYFQDVTLPWTKKNRTKPYNTTTVYDNYSCVNFTGENFYGHVFHFFGDRRSVFSENILGYVTIFEAWTETKEAAGKLSAAIGVDLYNKTSNQSLQDFSGRNYLIGNKKRIIMGHNIPDVLYDEIVEKGKSPSVCLEMFKSFK